VVLSPRNQRLGWNLHLQRDFVLSAPVKACMTGEPTKGAARWHRRPRTSEVIMSTTQDYKPKLRDLPIGWGEDMDS
jgi:hypothetical protein